MEAYEYIIHYSDQILCKEFRLKINNAEFLIMEVIGADNLADE